MNKHRSMANWRIYALVVALVIAGCSSPHIGPSQLIPEGQVRPAEEKNCFKIYHKSKRYCKEGVTVVVLRGSPYELGYARGVLLREEIQDWARESLVEIEQKPTGRSLNQDSLKKNIAMLESAIPTEFKVELEGLAASSGVCYETLLLLNVWASLDKGCTSIALLGYDGKLLRSRNYDWYPIRLLKPTILTIYQPEEGYAFMSVYPPGIIGIATAMNEKGITFGSHALPGTKHEGNGLPSGILNRLILQYSASLDEVNLKLVQSRRGGPKLWLVTDRETAAIFEFDQQNVYRTDMSGESLILTNHGHVLPNRAAYLASRDRYDFVEKFAIDHGKLMDLQSLIKLNRTDIIAWAQPLQKIKNLHALITRPATLDFWVAIDDPPATKGRWVGFNLLKELFGLGQDPDPSLVVSDLTN